jgi:hypothetical protein
VKEIGGFVPVNPHSTEVVSEEVIKRISRKETQAVRDPVRLIGNISVVWFCLSAKVTDSFGPFLIGTRPDT